MPKEIPKLPLLRPGCAGVSPYNLYQPVPSEFGENMTYIEYLIGLVKQMNIQNQTINDQTDNIKDQNQKISDLYDAFNNLNIDEKIATLLPEEVQKQLDEMLTDGTITNQLRTDLNQDNVIILGDSYGTGNSEDITKNTTPWPVLLNNNLNFKTCTINASNGSGFTKGKTWLVQLQEVAGTITDKAGISKIIIGGGYNDASSEINTIINAMGTFAEYAHQQFPNAKIYLAHLGWGIKYIARQRIAHYSIPAYEQCGKFGIQYIANTEFILHNYSNYQPDGYHPNQDGQNAIASFLGACLSGGSNNVDYFTIDLDIYELASNITLNSGENLFKFAIQQLHNGRIDLAIDPSYYTITTNNMTLQDWTTICTIKGGFIAGAGLKNVYVGQSDAFLAFTDNTTLVTNLVWSVSYNNDGTITLNCKRPLNSSYKNVKNINSRSFHISMPSLYN